MMDGQTGGIDGGIHNIPSLKGGDKYFKMTSAEIITQHAKL